jgi:uncharacterized protein YciI
MKTHTPVFFIIAYFLSFQTIKAQTNEYDAALAKKLNADDYGMKPYVLVLLKKGSVELTDKNVRDSVFHGHMANIMRLAAEKKLILAGPTGENDKNYEGIFVYNTADTTEARQWLNTDPAIQSKELDAEIYAWYGPAALQQVIDINRKLQKKSF